MNKKEKTLAEKMLTNFRSSPKHLEYTPEEELIISRWITHKILNKEAFVDVTSANGGPKEYLQINEYPFTLLGDEERNKDWYLKFRSSRNIIIIRDILTFLAFSLSLYLTISKALQN